MGYIKEPKGVDFIVEPGTQTEEDRLAIGEAIAAYHRGARGSVHATKTYIPKEKTQGIKNEDAGRNAAKGK